MRRFILPLSFVLALASGCSAFDFEIEQVTEEVVLDGDLQAFRAGVSLPNDTIPTQTFTFDLEDEPAGIYVRAVTVRLTDTIPSARNMAIPFSFVDALEFYIQPSQPGSTLPRVRIAWTGEPAAGHEVPMEVDAGVDLTPYVREGFDIIGELEGVVPAADISFETRVLLAVDVF